MAECDRWKEEQDATRKEWKDDRERKCAEREKGWKCEEIEKKWQCDNIEKKWQCDQVEKKWVCDVEEEKKSCSSWNSWFAWICIGWAYVKTGVCLLGRWIETGVCLAGQWIETGVCLAGKWIETGVCLAGKWVDTAACKVWTEVGNAGWVVGTSIGWAGCKVYDAVIEPVVDWILEGLGFCTEKRKVGNVSRQRPLPPGEVPASVKAFKNNRRLILCLDGGGVRGILTLQALKALEKHVGGRCIDIFDMFAGTSTGSIIAGALAWGMSVDDLIKTYRDKHRIIFTASKSTSAKNAGIVVGATVLGAGMGAALGFVIGGPVGAVVGAFVGGGAALYGSGELTAQIIIPKYDNQALKCILKSIFDDDTLAHCHRDILITTKDTVRGETSYFSAFHPTPMPFNPDGMPKWLADVRGTYKDLRLREAIVASAGSAPIFFEPVGRFIDGGVGSYNNVSYAAPVEALRYSATPLIAKMLDDHGRDDPNGKWPVFRFPPDDQLYRSGQVGVVAFGTGKQINNMRVGEAMGISTALGWVPWIIGEGMDDADEQQSYIAEEELDLREQSITYRRFQIHFTPEALEELRQFDSSLPSTVDSTELELDAVTKYDFLEKVGVAFGQWLSSPRQPGLPPRFELDEIVELGHPVRVRPVSFHINVYSKEVKKELREQNR